jgi:5'-3' exonuclease
MTPAPAPMTQINNDVLFDYIFLCFFLGNDFLPHFPTLNIRTTGINRLLNAYKHVFSTKNGATLTKDRQIIWKNVRLFVAHLAEHELTFLHEEYKLREKMSKRMEYQHVKEGEDENLMLPLKERSGEIYINPAETGWEARYYTTLFKLKIDDTHRANISTNYLEGLEWTMKYYSTGCPDWRWTYNYYYPPLLTDLIKYVPYFERTLVPLKPKNPLPPLVQLCYVLPPTSMDILPPLVKKSVLAKFPDWYVGNYYFLWAFCKFFWEAHVDLPEIDIVQLEEHIHKMK